MESITIDVTHHPLHPECATLRLRGFLYANTLVNLDRALQPFLISKKKKLVLDLSETNYISSGGWALLLTVCPLFRESGGDLVLVGMKPEVKDAFELLEYHKVMRSFPSVESALKEGFGNATEPAKT